MKLNTLQLLEEWEKQYNSINEVYETLKFMFDASSDSKTIRPIFEMFDRYTDVLSDLIGDETEMLAWYAWDNEFGKKSLKARAGSWKTERPITNLKTLEKLINDSKR